MEYRILAVDDENDFLDTIKRGLIISGYRQVQTKNNPVSALSLFQQGEVFDLALIDITMPKMSGIELLEEIKALSPLTECIMVTAHNEAQLAVDCIRKGAYDYLVKPISKEDLNLCINRALERRRFLEILDIRKGLGKKDFKKNSAFDGIVTQSTEMMRILREAELHAASNVPVLITGESGTGKDLLARAIHMASPRSKAPFSAINMASISGSLFDAEFFGHTKGAFTGAESVRKGYLSATNKGSLFLDEIGSLPPDLQGKLLRVLQGGEYIPVGSDTVVKTDLRFIAATNEDIEKQIAKKQFRPDLYYRLRGAWLHLPPLRKRRGDVPLLAEHFFAQLCPEAIKTGFHPDAMALLADYPFPGNIRELSAIVQSAFNMAQGKPIGPEHLPVQFQHGLKTTSPQEETQVVSLSAIEKQHILRTYERTGKNKSKTARLLEIGLNTLRRKLRSYGIE